MDLRTQLRFSGSPEGARAILEATNEDAAVSLTLYADGPDEGAALAALAERTREVYASLCGVVDTVEELMRAYYGDGE